MPFSFIDIQYSHLHEMLDDLQKRIVDIVFIDTFSLASEEGALKARQLKVKKMENTETGYGIVLSGLTAALQPDVVGMILTKEAEITQYIVQLSSSIPV